MLKHLFFLILILPLFTQSHAQDLSKKRMDASVFDEWKTINEVQISNDGRWVTYNKSVEEQDKELILYNTETKQSKSFPRSSAAQISHDNGFLIYKSAPPQDSLREMRRRKVKKDDLPGDTLCIYNLRTGYLEKIADFKNYKSPKEWGPVLLYQMKAQKKGKGATVGVDSSTQAITLKWDDEDDERGSRLYLKYLQSARMDSFIYVTDYTFAEKANQILLHSTGDDSTFMAGVYKYDAELQRMSTVSDEKGKVQHMVLSKDGSKAAFLLNKDTTDRRIPPFEMMYAEGVAPAKVIAHHNSRNLPSEWFINEHYKPHFSDDMSSLFYGINPEPVQQDTSILDDEIVNVEVWSYQDNRLHTQQKVRKPDDVKKAYIMKYDCNAGSSMRLTSPEGGADLLLSSRKNEKSFLVTEEKPYLSTISWEGFPSYKDVYLVDQSGKKELLASKVRGNIRRSPNGKYIYYFSSPDSEWIAIDVKSKKKISLSANVSSKVYNELHDSPSFPWAYGIAGWTEDDKQLIMYDRYDMWIVDPSKNARAKKLTDGRADKITYRYLRLDPEEKNISTADDLTLSFYNDENGSGGYANYSWKNNSLSELISSDHSFNRPLKAKHADKIIFRRQSFREFPELEITDGQFKEPLKISETNPQQADYSWGDVEWHYWKAFDGQELRGILVKPDNFDPNKKYPLLVNFYERSSNRIHRYRGPYPHRSTINYSYFVNRGYVVFNPDVTYEIGYPGKSAYNSVVSGVESLIEEGFIDKDRVGVQGHSWGGYQVAHLITKTDIFACAESGAPVVNMISAYGGIRWQTGLSRMFQYEHTQSRIGGTLWEKPHLYIENSPIFEMDKVNTPVLIMHNDKDGHVPWYQGIEYFVAMRRLGKPAWMLNYNEEPHWPLKRVNRIDFNLRMEQFFDHYLMGEPMPTWMKTGVSAIDKGINQGYELDNKQ